MMRRSVRAPRAAATRCAVFSLLVRQREDFIVRPQTSESLLLQPFLQIRMIVDDRLACDDSGGIAGAREVENLGSGTFGIARDARRAGLQHAEIRHAPLGRVAADQHHAIALLDALAGEESGDARGQLAQIGVGVLFLAPSRSMRIATRGA